KGNKDIVVKIPGDINIGLINLAWCEKAARASFCCQICIKTQYDISFGGSAFQTQAVEKCDAISGCDPFEFTIAFLLKVLFDFWPWSPLRDKTIIGINGQFFFGLCKGCQSKCSTQSHQR